MSILFIVSWAIRLCFIVQVKHGALPVSLIPAWEKGESSHSLYCREESSITCSHSSNTEGSGIYSISTKAEAFISKCSPAEGSSQAACSSCIKVGHYFLAKHWNMDRKHKGFLYPSFLYVIVISGHPQHMQTWGNTTAPIPTQGCINPFKFLKPSSWKFIFPGTQCVYVAQGMLHRRKRYLS